MRSVLGLLLAISVIAAGNFFFSTNVNAQTVKNILGTPTQVNTFASGSSVQLTDAGTNGICYIFFSGTSENKLLALALTAQSSNKQIYAQVDSGFTCANYAWSNGYGFMVVN